MRAELVETELVAHGHGALALSETLLRLVGDHAHRALSGQHPSGGW
jgi:hypothetical protein